ncbi:MAG: SDR family NAD(P)-dependent oxidoreductase, partial [Anaerolineae bacterium]|nr:SDR family NAD(P)-dependent oxidoreductase [Anaerolineae bacterium]
MHLDLTDQVAVVTGGAHRVGRAIALELARRGAHLLIHYGGSAAAATETVREVKSLGVDAHAVQGDLREPSGVEAIFTALREHYGKLNILVNSASNFQARPLLEVTLDDWQETLA